MENRKSDHIVLAFQSQMETALRDHRFHYEPLLESHPKENGHKPFIFLGRTHSVPMWVSSMTGGTQLAGKINTNLARVCREFGMGMGLGSCRIILEDDKHFADFNMRPEIGNELPLYANLGICQVEQLIEAGKTSLIHRLVNRLQADGLIIHVNPMQEWFQPEGDRVKNPPIDTIKRLLDAVSYNIIVKEVGQGLGPGSLRQLLLLPLAAIEFAAFGGTNFARVELMRSDTVAQQYYGPFAAIGEDAVSMTGYVNAIVEEEGEKVRCREIIISGGIKHFLDGYYLINKIKLPAVYGQASAFLKYARENYDDLHRYVEMQVRGLQLAQKYLRVRL